MQLVPNLLVPGSTPSCASEPIHVPGSIQPHGLLLLFDAESGELAHWAGDFDGFLGIEPRAGQVAAQLFGTPLAALVGPEPLIDGKEAC